MPSLDRAIEIDYARVLEVGSARASLVPSADPIEQLTLRGYAYGIVRVRYFGSGRCAAATHSDTLSNDTLSNDTGAIVAPCTMSTGEQPSEEAGT